MIKTWCEDCDGVTNETRNKSARYWTCIHFPWTDDHGAVRRQTPTGPAIHNYCSNINKGACPLFKRRIEGQHDNGL